LDGEYRTEPRLDEDATPLSAVGSKIWEVAVRWTKIAGEKLKEVELAGEGEAGDMDMEKREIGIGERWTR
jgi:hypothetical protein